MRRETEDHFVASLWLMAFLIALIMCWAALGLFIHWVLSLV